MIPRVKLAVALAGTATVRQALAVAVVGTALVAVRQALAGIQVLAQATVVHLLLGTNYV